MTVEEIGRLVILSGPSCVGKSPLAKALGRFHPDLSVKLQPIVLHNSRSPDPASETDGIIIFAPASRSKRCATGHAMW
jgi:guanylate kinase